MRDDTALFHRTRLLKVQTNLLTLYRNICTFTKNNKKQNKTNRLPEEGQWAEKTKQNLFKKKKKKSIPSKEHL